MTAPISAPVSAAVDHQQPPQDYYTKPLETWTFRELQDALGKDRVAELLDTSLGNVRMLRKRNTASLERMQILQAAVREDEQNIRAQMVTIHTTGAFRAHKTRK